MKDNVLIVAAHADDEVLGVGGTIARHVEKGDQVTVVIVTNRDSTFSKFTLDEKFHAARARGVLGYNSLKFLDLKDMDLDGKIYDTIKPLEAIYDRLSPTIVYTHHGGDNNQDHRAVFEATTVICRPKWQPPRQLFCYETISSTDQCTSFSYCNYQPNYYNTLTRDQLDKKIRAFDQYKHQLEEWPLPRCTEVIETYAKFRGVQCGTKYAEALMLMREIKS